MKTERVVNCDPKTYNFLTAAIAEGAHRISPDPRYAEAWVRQRIFIFSYYGTSATLEQLAGIYGLKSRERVSQILEAGITRLWRNCSPELQQLFPLKKIPKGKPMSSSLGSHLRLSAVRGGKTVMILKGLQEGKSVKEIADSLPRGVSAVSDARLKLRKFGIIIPYKTPNTENNPKLFQVLSNEDTDDLAIQEALNQITASFLNRHGRKPDSPILSLSTIVLDSTGYHLNRTLRKLAEDLRELGIPLAVVERSVGQGSERVIQRYYIVAKHHRARIEAALVKLGVLEQARK